RNTLGFYAVLVVRAPRVPRSQPWLENEGPEEKGRRLLDFAMSIKRTIFGSSAKGAHSLDELFDCSCWMAVTTSCPNTSINSSVAGLAKYQFIPEPPTRTL